MNNLKKVLLFAAGAIFGSAVTYKLVKDKYNEYANEEIEEMKEYFDQKLEEMTVEEAIEAGMSVDVEEAPKKVADVIKEVLDKSVEEQDRIDYSNIIKKEAYNTEVAEPEPSEGVDEEPYVISPDEFNELDDYTTHELTYFSDGYLTDSMNELLSDKDIENSVGWDCLNHFGEYDEDSVYVRNDRLKSDYEILADVRRYTDVQADKQEE